MWRCAVTLVLLAASVVQLSAQTNAAAMAARRWRQQHERAVVEESLVLPDVTNGRTIARNAAALAETMRRRGLEPQLLSVDGSNPVVFSQIRTPQATHLRRSASDDKASIVAMTAALDAITAAGLRPRSNVRFVFDGEEENGSANLERVLGANSALRRRSVADLRWYGMSRQSAALDDQRPRHPWHAGNTNDTSQSHGGQQ
jgi:hypothetical protein